ncbi:MAG: tetratricopeptide repeat protein [Planctomycetes bacterium]|nr:tetratricopeptide repeat protein [Planctomycetota bacterium]
MRKMGGIRFPWMLLLAIAASACGFRAFAVSDEVKLTNGQVQKGVVTKDAVEGVTLQVGQGNLTFDAVQIESIEWDIQNVEWQTGIHDFNAGDYASAAQAFQSMAGDADTMRTFREVAKPYLAYLVGESFYRAGKNQDAVSAFETFMHDYATSRYVPLAVGSLVDAAIQAKKYDKVPKLLEKLEALGGENKSRALIFGAELDMVQNNMGGAESKFNSAASSSTNKETQGLARLGLARIAIAKKEIVKARQAAEQALSSSSSRAVAGTAYLIIGDALFAEGTAAKPEEAKEKLLDASLAYLRIPVSYPDKRTEPEALFKAGECFAALSKLPGRPADHERAMSMYNMVIQKYPVSRWAKDAQASVKNLR